jgi:hypothetical protein
MPALGYFSPNRKPFKITIPVDQDLRDRLQTQAQANGIKQTELARRLIGNGIIALEGGKPLFD